MSPLTNAEKIREQSGAQRRPPSRSGSSSSLASAAAKSASMRDALRSSRTNTSAPNASKRAPSSDREERAKQRERRRSRSRDDPRIAPPALKPVARKRTPPVEPSADAEGKPAQVPSPPSGELSDVDASDLPDPMAINIANLRSDLEAKIDDANGRVAALDTRLKSLETDSAGHEAAFTGIRRDLRGVKSSASEAREEAADALRVAQTIETTVRANQGAIDMLVKRLAKLERGQARLQAAANANRLEPPPAEPPTGCLLYTSPSPRDRTRSRMPSSA